jgi:hypothetical protein
MARGQMRWRTCLCHVGLSSQTEWFYTKTRAAADSRPSYTTERRGFSSTTGGFGSSGGGFERGLSGMSMSDAHPPNRRLTPSDRRADGYSVREELPLPSAPPFTAHLANLSFEANEDNVKNFFQDCEVKEVRIVRDKMDDKPKGFGYVTFETLDGLKTALSLSGGNIDGRNVRVSVAEPRKPLIPLC